MRTRPRSILFLTAAFALFPLVLISIMAFESHFSLSQIQNVWSWSYTLTAVGSIVVAGSIWSVRRWGYYACLTLVSTGVLHSLITYCRTPDVSGYTSLMMTIVTAAITAFLLQRHVAAPYFNPRQRWWETPARYRAHFQVLASIQGKESPVELVDISTSGCFIHIIENLAQGDMLHVQIAFLDMRLELLTKVVRKCAHPIEGVGLMFLDLTRSDRKDLGLLMTHLQSHPIKTVAENSSTAA